MDIQEMQLDQIEQLIDTECADLKKDNSSGRDIAIVGISARASCAENIEEFWRSLCCGEDLIRDFPEKRRLDIEEYAGFLGRKQERYAEKGYLENIDEFAPSFFHIFPYDAALIDPSQRLFLEEAWKSLEDAGFTREMVEGSNTGVFVGYTTAAPGYGQMIGEMAPELSDRALPGSVNSITASRISYFLDLKGPAVMIDTACSSSLVAVHAACRSIRNGECEMAIAGGVKYYLLPEDGGKDDVTVESKDGRTRTFDMFSDGAGSGEGVGAVVLKPLSQAEADGDYIYAVIKGSAVNQDGTSVGITAPNVAAQEEVILKAWEDARVDPRDISYIEAHGTATKLGDPVEVSGIERAFKKYTDKKQFCAVGSVKTNIGHLDCAAGVMGLIKCALSLERKKLPPSIHFHCPNMEIDFVNSPLYVKDKLSDWEGGNPYLCGVSSFGLSGTNCHIVLEGYENKRAKKKPVKSNEGFRAFPRERCWFQGSLDGAEKRKKTAKLHPLVDECILFSDRLYVFKSELSAGTHTEVKEHVIGEKNVLAGTSYIEMIMYAASAAFGRESIEFNQVVFLSPMIFENGGAREVNVILYKENAPAYKVIVQSRLSSEADWTVHVEGEVSPILSVTEQYIDRTEILNRISAHPVLHYENAADSIVQVGERWNTSKNMWVSDNEALVLAELDEKFAGEMAHYFAYPSLLDAAVNSSSALNGGDLYLPFGYGNMKIYKRFPRTLYGYTKRKMELERSGEISSFDIVLFDESGSVVAKIGDYSMKKTHENQRSQFFSDDHSYFHRIGWAEQSFDSNLSDRPESILVVQDTGEHDEKLLKLLQNSVRGNFCELALNYSKDEDSFDNLQAVQSFFEENDPVGIQEIVFLVSEKSSAKKILQCFYGLIHSLCRRKKSDFVNVHIAARSAGEFPGAVHSSLIGMAESMDLEFKKIEIDCVVYDSQADYDLLVSLIYNRNKPLLTLMTRNKLRRPMIEKIPAKDAGEFSLSNGGTYVITGGAGGIALEIADRFLDLNSGINLVLLARSVRTDASGWEDLARNGADSKTRGKYRKLLGLQKKADSVAVYNCDVSNAEEARVIFKRICGRYGKINGLIHAAGVAGGGFAARKEWDEYIDVLNPKLDGTDNILQFACANPMEFVWLFSSYSTVFPTAGQSDYIAANAYMDGIVNEEKYPSNIKVINWSGWREAGMAFENHVEEKDSPVDFLSSEEGVRSLLKAAVFREKRILIGKLNTAGLASGFDEQKKYIELDKELTNEIKRTAQKNEHREIEAAKIDVVVHGKESGVLTPTEQKIAQAWARILGLREIYYYDKFLEIGGDSLSATYLQKEIDKYFPGAMDITDVFVYPSIYEMAKYIDQTISRNSETGQEADDIKSLLDKLYAGEIDVSDAEKML